MLRFCSLGSGSTGNATLVEAVDGDRTVRVLVDCGLTLRALTLRMAERGCTPADLSAVFVTHEHSDHVGCATALMRRHGTPVWMSEGTWAGAAREHAPPPQLRVARDAEPIVVGDLLELRPYAVPHDAREPLQLTLRAGAARLGVLTDAGSETARIVEELQGCTALLLECNHDLDLLAASDYPYFLKRRIAGPLGHLSNPTAVQILERCRHEGLKHVVAAHLSERNNRPDLVAPLLAEVLGGRPQHVTVADPRTGSPWIDC